MYIYNANYWEDYKVYASKKKAKCQPARKKRINKKAREERLKNISVAKKEIAQHYMDDMKDNPSALEKKMQEFLENQNIHYEFQKILYIRNKDRYIRKFYIADFYIPTKNIIIETDGKFHDDQIKEDEYRTKEIQKHYPNMKIIRWRWNDFSSIQKMKELVQLLKL